MKTNTILIIVSVIAVIAIIAYFMKKSGYKYPVEAPKYRKIEMVDGTEKCFNFYPSNVKENFGIHIEETDKSYCKS